jgi:hypothetical protein
VPFERHAPAAQPWLSPGAATTPCVASFGSEAECPPRWERPNGFSPDFADTSKKADHPQTKIRVGEALVSVDQGMAELIVLLNRAGVATVTSCIGSEKVYGFVMIVGFDSVQRFMQIWERYLVPLGHAMPTLDVDARDSEWRAEIGSDYPFAQQVPVDGVGLSYTTIWRNYTDDLALVMPALVWAISRYLGGS